MCVNHDVGDCNQLVDGSIQKGSDFGELHCLQPERLLSSKCGPGLARLLLIVVGTVLVNVNIPLPQTFWPHTSIEQGDVQVVDSLEGEDFSVLLDIKQIFCSHGLQVLRQVVGLPRPIAELSDRVSAFRVRYVDNNGDQVEEEERANPNEKDKEKCRNDRVHRVHEAVHGIDPSFESAGLENCKESLENVVEAGNVIVQGRS
mmetsp:Transcript_1819/g.3586  ORF Transcript_1819/g.3586 Transcript_1819/m.3586 type:complete len:202 (+) Transcript_1819:4050-4655(+)